MPVAPPAVPVWGGLPLVDALCVQRPLAMLRLALGALLLVLSGCAAPPALDAPAPVLGPERPLSLAALPPAPQPDRPQALRPNEPPAKTAGAPHSHDAPPSVKPNPLAGALDAYLALADALASDDLAPVAFQAEQFLGSWDRTTETAPADAPHLWHLRTSDIAAVRASALSLAEAGTLTDAREAFGHLSAPFAALVDAHGAPAGYALTRFICGMQSALPEGGVWLQRGTEARNPYGGSAMRACATDEAAVPTRAPDLPAMSPEGGHPSGHDG